jgi:hypothetical protein
MKNEGLLHKVFDIAETLKGALKEAGYQRCEVDTQKNIGVYETYEVLSISPAYRPDEEQEEEIRGYTKQNIPDDFRWAVFERDNFTCQKCGSRRFLCVDHIHPESKGGKLTMDNAQTLCKTCNSRKGAR